jgi:ABC-type uncharacterized transport system permease subunit
MSNRLRKLLADLTPVLIALLCGAIVILLTGGNPFKTYWLLAREAFGSWRNLRSTFLSSTALLFTATATSIGFRAGAFTLAAEGAFIAGGFAAAVVGVTYVHLGGFIGIVAMMVAAVLAGTIVALIPALLKVYLDVDEVVSTLMFNFVTLGVVTWLVQTYFLAPREANAATDFVPKHDWLPGHFLGIEMSLGFIVALLAIAFYAVLMSRTRLGYEFKALGYSKPFARSIGINDKSTLLIAMMLTGAVAGVGGAVHLTGLVHRYVAGFSAGYGFTGLAIALLAKFRPLGLIGGSLLLGAISSAGSTVQLFTHIPLDIVNVLQGFIMIAAVIESRSLFKTRFSKAKKGEQ